MALFMMHGATYALMRTEGDLHHRLGGWINNTIIFFVICYVTTTMATPLYVPHMAGRVRANVTLARTSRRANGPSVRSPG